MKRQFIWIFGYLVIGSSLLSQKSLAEESFSTWTACRTVLEEQQHDLSLDYNAFDQSAAQGWRPLAVIECYREAAELIVSYLDSNPGLTGNEREILAFHAGQMLAYDNDYDSAISFFEQSFFPQGELPLDFKPYADAWDAYVNATIAFLRQDQAALMAYRADVAAGPTLNGEQPMNLEVVDRLIENFGKPYRQAYGGR
ncbi:hypothetical protein IQ265_21650 [Nodosilinea sp. LEGE 06152]|uniref:hypothetical protein n=1 Tax=Nodosilinea sp. LEGE 06152 TaxID=2777966 RepID=UPI001880C14A|nr:hypothetical protein [Nodosilinea sp. LEGE 06152]MBE9159413.1 hypothetical protein [Nodosilinea sp. LEGE 06152]